MNKITSRHVLAVLSTVLVGTGMTWAQSTPSPTVPPTTEPEEETVVLSPFVVTAAEDSGYLATATLAGSRVRTELKDIASSITVITKQFMDDIGAVNNQTLLPYTTNTEVGGLYGNFAGVGNTFIDGSGENATNLLRPQTNTRVRGLDSADNTRDYFQTDIPWDGFNIGRVDMQRGPNSILFGIGSPAGIINTSVNTAGFKTEGFVQNRIDRFGSMRNSLDYNHVLIPDELSVRVAAVDDNSKYRQKPAFNRNRRVFGAIRWDPKLFGQDSSARTSIRANTEHGDIKANRPRGLPPIDRLTPFFDADKVNKQFFDGQDADAAGVLPYRTREGAATNYWIAGGRGIGEWDAPVLYFNNTASPFYAQQGRARGAQYATTGLATGNFFPVGISSYNQWAVDLDRWGPQNGLPDSVLDPVAGASKGFYKTIQIRDPEIFDFYNILLDGPTKKEWQNWKSFDVSFDQTFFHDRLGFQAVYDRQKYRDGSENLLGWSPFLSIDIMENTMQYAGVYTDLAVPNPNVGRVYTSGRGTGGSRETDRENIRFTAFGELRASDYLEEGTLSRILGRHIITGLYSQEQYDVEDRAWNRYAASNAWTDLIYNPALRSGGEQKPAPMSIEQITYLTPTSVVGYNSASQLNIPGISVNQVPPETLAAKYYDSHWKWPTNPSHPDYVDPAAVWSSPVGTDPEPDNSTQGSNPANFVGWTDTTVSVLNADKGDINDLYTSGAKGQTRTSSKGVTWQAFLVEDLIVATAGWRTDTVKRRAGYPDQDIITQTGVPSMDYDLLPQEEDGIKSGDNISWGVVVHTPRKLRERLPWDSNISFGFNDSNNNRVENRYGFDGLALPNAKGHSRDYSVVLSALDDRLTFKVAYYKTTVKDANISSVNSESATLGNQTGQLRGLEVQGTASALMMLAGFSQTPGSPNYANNGKDYGWYWNWAMIAGDPGTGGNNAWNEDYWNPAGTAESKARFEAHPETIKARAAVKGWQDNMQPQSFFDALGYNIDVAAVKAGDWAHAINEGRWQPWNYVGGTESTPGAGRINGVYPTGTVDNESKGWEFELTGRPLKNWDISLNASKQFASQTALGANLVSFIEEEYAKFQGPAGDLRQWWGGDRTFRVLYEESIWAAYQFQKETNGKLVGEMAPWRLNMVNNFRFDQGLLKGANVGFAYRWQDGTIQGYALNEARDNLDINKPYWSEPEDNLDLWAGYERNVTEKIKWRIQLNLGSVGTKPRLIPYNVQPDGTPGAYRIAEGMTWSLSNTLSF